MTTAQQKPVLSLARPLPSDNPLSVEFMHKDLARSGLVPADMDAYAIELQGLASTPAFVIPYESERMYRIRYDRAVDKYSQPRGLREVWTSPHQNRELFRGMPTIYIVEGEKKAAKFVKTWPNLPTFGIGGCWNWSIKLETGQKQLLPVILESLKPGTKVVAIFDGDIQTKPGVQQAAHSLALVIANLGCTFEVYRPPNGKGVDDWLVADTSATLLDLVKIELTDLEVSRKQLYLQLDLSMNEKGTSPVLNETACQKLLTHYFTDRLLVDKRIGPIYENEAVGWDSLEQIALEYIQGELLPHMPFAKIRSGLSIATKNLATDLLADLFRKLEWDGVKRVDTWATEYFESAFPAYTAEWGRQLIVGMVLRCLQPGTKVDKALILAGPQGVGKSTFFEELATFQNHKFYHACTELLGDGDASRTQIIAFKRALIVDLAEGVVFETKKSVMDRTKQRITQVEDEYREVYAKASSIEKRGFIFVGTTNRTDQLGDATGSRRYLPIYVTKITKLPYDVKLQLIAEVVAQENAIRASNWHELRVTIEDAPDELRHERGHIKNIQELVNTQFARPDYSSEFIQNLIEEGRLATLKEEPDTYFITANYISARDPDSFEFKSKNMVGRILSSLSTSETFPYKLEVKRRYLATLNMGPEVLGLYMNGINNKVALLNGYVVTKK